MNHPEPLSTTPPMIESAVDTAGSGSTRRQWLFLLRIVILVVVVVLGYKVVRAGLFGVSAYNSASELRQMRGDFSTGDLAQAQGPLSEMARATAALEREMRLFAPALRGARVIPGIGSTIAAIPDLLVAGREYMFIANEGFGLALAAQAAQPDAPLPRLALMAMADNPEAFAVFAERAAIASDALARIPAKSLMPKLATPAAQLQSVAELAEAGLGLSPHLPEMMGLYGPRTYLLLVQNNHELRATGGFISAVGLVTLEDGAPGDIALTDSYNIRRDDVDHPWAPAPMQEQMGIQLVFLRDANWSPDLPTSGQLARALYNQDAGALVDGVATVDLRAVELLVEALEPLKVEGADESVTGENLVDQIKQFWDRPIETGDTKESAGLQEWWKQRKDFMPALAEAALNRIRSGRFNPLAVADAAKWPWTNGPSRCGSLIPAVDSLLAERDWNGSVQPVDGADFLGLVDTNMGYNKVDSVLQRSVAYTVTWPDGAGEPALAEATVTYRHPVEVPGHVCDQRPRYGDNYDAMTERCYFDYVRLYAPAGSELLSMDGVDPASIDSAAGENGTQVFSGFFEMLPGSEHVVRFQYRLPPSISPENYRLAVRRQSGAGPLPLTVDVAGNKLAATVRGGQLVWELGSD